MGWLMYAIVMGLTNMWRGRGFVPNSRYWAWALWTLETVAATYWVGHYMPIDAVLFGIVVGIGCFYWLEHPWGQGFAAFTGVWTPGVTIPWIDAICQRVYPYPGADQPDPKAYARGTLFMALRGLYIVPLFVLLAVMQHMAVIAGLGLIGVMQGFSYGIVRFVPPCNMGHWNCQAATAEFLTMTFFALAFALALA